MNDTTRQKPRHKTLKSLVSGGCVLIGFAAAYFYGPQLLDMVRASQYTPSPHVSSIEHRVVLTSAGRRIFHATSPKVENSEQFNASCQSTERTAAILGCYYRDQIYLYNVQNDELDGALEVTAAHELLHAAYARLNIFEKQNVDKMVKAAYQKVKDDDLVKDLMEYYSEAEPGEEINELHSILGTTVANLDPRLEQYYARYFTNRAQIVSLNLQYNKIFAEVNQQAEALRSKISAEDTTLKSDIETYKINLNQLNSDVESFNQRARSGEFASQAAFDTARDALTARTAALNEQQTSLNDRINKYNAMISEYNKIAVRANQLNQSINGVSAPTEVAK